MQVICIGVPRTEKLYILIWSVYMLKYNGVNIFNNTLTRVEIGRQSSRLHDESFPRSNTWQLIIHAQFRNVNYDLKGHCDVNFVDGNSEGFIQGIEGERIFFKHQQTVDTHLREPQIGGGLFRSPSPYS